MKLQSVKIENFRAVGKIELLLDSQLTVLHGNNAHGKTSVLSAIATGLGAVPSLLPDVSGNKILKKDRREGSAITKITLTTTEGITWTRSSGITRSPQRHVRENSSQEPPRNPLKELKRWLEINALKSRGTPVDLPIMALYDTERVVGHLKKERTGLANKSSRFAALSGALTARTNYKELFEWFYMKENEELREQRERRNHDFRLKDLTAVRDAIKLMIEGVGETHVDHQPLRFVITERLDNGVTEKRTLDQLSGGYQAVLALAADLAWRMAQGNPHRSNPLESEAIVLIDEIELHLHPSWQQRILSDLMRTFPNVQFIVSTHSPQILTTVQPAQIIELHRQGNNIVAHGAEEATFGAKSGDVLYSVMGVDERPSPNSFVQKLESYIRLIADEEGESEEAITLRLELDALSPNDPALVSADIEIKRQQVMKALRAT